MKIVVAICGVPVTVIGLLLVGSSCWEWYENGGLSYFKYHDLSTLPFQFFWVPILGVIMTVAGGFGVLSGFKTQWLRVNERLRRRAPIALGILVVILFVQCAVLLFQGYELVRYDEEIEPHMPTMTHPDRSDPVTRLYGLGAIMVPFWAQFILVPTIWLLAVFGTKKQGWGMFISLSSVVIAGASWFGALLGLAFTVGTFD